MRVQSEHLRLRTADLHWRAIDGEVIALEGRASTYLATNPSGALLWQALVEGATRERLVNALVAEYGIDRGRAIADVDVYVDALSTQGLLEP
jgi:Coenzyme PQQ synthesis protein D (PqqD)